MASFTDFFPSSPVFLITVSNGKTRVNHTTTYPPHPELPHSEVFPLPFSLRTTTTPSTTPGHPTPTSLPLPSHFLVTESSPPSLHPSIHVVIPEKCFPGRLLVVLPRSLFMDPYQWGRNQIDPTYQGSGHAFVNLTLLGGPLDVEQPVMGPQVWPRTLVLFDWTSSSLGTLHVPFHVRVFPPTVEGKTSIVLQSSDLLVQCPLQTSPWLVTSVAASAVQWSVPTSYLHHQPWVPWVTHGCVWLGLGLLLVTLFKKRSSHVQKVQLNKSE
ncbi:hypothetical protein HMI54_015308 [Coelomomyces lativittatus]|nr:hypothetical protein HMI55_007337 [Coelomomyces lativittatus]KAJ1511649.1 hypothetical protein HMI56_005129 [Coelomomyces lativittatus]KAJ1518533.1 hypothetical protein HMI54_015308 [Coelomomyces lativittatus]